MPTFNSSCIRQSEYHAGTPFLISQQELSDMFEPEKVAHLFRRAANESEGGRVPEECIGTKLGSPTELSEQFSGVLRRRYSFFVDIKWPVACALIRKFRPSKQERSSQVRRPAVTD